MRLRPGWIALLATLTSGALFSLAFPPASLHGLAWFALVPFFVSVRRGGPGRALLLTWLWCVFAAYFVGDWFPEAVADYFHQPAAVAIALFVGVFTVMAAPFYMAFTWAYRVLARRFSLALPLLAGAAWTSAEFGRGRLFTETALFIGNPWGLIGYSQSEVLPLVQIAALTGVYGVSFCIGCANGALAELWLRSWEHGKLERRQLSALAIALAPTLAALAYGGVVLGQKTPPEGGAVPIAIVQGNLNVGSRWRSDLYGANLETYLRLTWDTRELGRPEIVFWPESALTFFLAEEPLYRKAIGRVLEPLGAELVAGGVYATGSDPPAFLNSIFTLDPDGEIRDRYDKQHLVPFAEYFPLGIDMLRRRFGRVRYFEPGPAGKLLETRAGPAGVVVCNEAMLPEVVGARVAAGAVYLVNPSNDSWIRAEKYAEQQLAFATFRAIEQRRYLVRASTAGPSAVIDPWGRVEVRTPALERAVVTGEVHPLEERSAYGRFGDVFAVLCLATVLGMLLVTGWAPRG